MVPAGLSSDLRNALEELQAKVDEPDQEGKTILHTVIFFDSLLRKEILNLILHNYPELTIQRDQDGFTPLGYAVQCDDHEVVQALLAANEASVLLRCKGQFVLDWHIQHISSYQEPSYQPCTKILEILIDQCEVSHLEQALETLYKCNTASIMEKLVREEKLYRRKVRTFGRQTRASTIDFWVWDWASIIIRGIAEKRSPPQVDSIDESQAGTKEEEERPQVDNKIANAPMPRRASSIRETTSLLHEACQISDIPVPFLIFAMRADPNQVRLADDNLNLPLHYVAMWQSRIRKSMSLTALVAEYPKAVHKINRDGKNPIDLEQASGSIIE